MTLYHPQTRMEQPGDVLFIRTAADHEPEGTKSAASAIMIERRQPRHGYVLQPQPECLLQVW
jgi:hypothetical protein